MSLATGPWGWGETSRFLGQEQRRMMPTAVAVVARIAVVVGIITGGIWCSRFIVNPNAATPPNAPLPANSGQPVQTAAANQIAPLKTPDRAGAPERPAPKPPATPTPIAATPTPKPATVQAPIRETAREPSKDAPAVASANLAPEPPPSSLAFAPSPAPVPAVEAINPTPAAPKEPAPAPAAVASLKPAGADQAVEPPPPPRRAGGRAVARASGSEPRCGLAVPKGYRVGWRIRGGKRTSCYVERIR